MAESKACSCRTQLLVSQCLYGVWNFIYLFCFGHGRLQHGYEKKFGKKGRIRSWIFNLVGIGLNPVALSLSLWFLSSISAPAKLIRAGLNWYINTCLNPLALVLTHCVALVTLALSPFPFALHYSKASSLLTKLRIILLLLFFN